MNDSTHSQTVSIENLVPGLYVIDLDIAWIDSPFFKQHRKIKNKQDILALIDAGVKEVVVDLDKCDPAALKLSNNDKRRQELGDSSEKNAKRGERNENKLEAVSLQKELAKAHVLRNKIVSIAETTLRTVEKGKAINIEAITPLIDNTLESLARNNQALLSLAHMSRKTQKLADHCFSVFCLSLNIAQLMELSDDLCRALGSAALLHDSCWVNLPINLMGKRKKYTESERKLIACHTNLKNQFIADPADAKLINRIIVEHHERADGSGYPNQLTGDQMHPLSRVLALVDYYDELIHQLLDRPGMLPTNALRQLYKESEAGKFDMNTCKRLISLLGIYPVSSAVKLSNGEKAVVVSVDSRSGQASVRVFYDAKGKPLKTAKNLNLADHIEDKAITIDSLLDPKNTDHDPNGLLLVNNV